MVSKNSCPKTSFDSLNDAELKALLKKLDYWIKDESMAMKDYGNFAECVDDPEFKVKFSSMSSDEGKHKGYHEELKKRVLAAMERKKEMEKKYAASKANMKALRKKLGG